MKKQSNHQTLKCNGNRPGIKDIWTAFMVRGATFTDNDIPVCPTTATALPNDVILWTEARASTNENALGERESSTAMPLSAFTLMIKNSTIPKVTGQIAPKR